MIKSVIVNNAYGIKSFEIDFTLKHLQDNKSLEDQVLSDDDKYYALTPMFLAKNAAGKTSFIKIINYVLRFASKTNFINEITSYAKDYFFKKAHTFNQQDILSNEFNNDKENVFVPNVGESITSSLFKEISFVGSDKVFVTINLSKNRFINLELTQKSFVLKLNDEKIDIKNLLDKILISNLPQKSINEIEQEIEIKLTSLISNIKFLGDDINSQSLFRDVSPITQVGELYIKNVTSNYINFISRHVGVETTKTILKNLDDNIKNIKLDSESNELEIYLKSIDSDWSINPRSLSFGTQKFLEIFAKSIPLFKKGGIMLVDEIENGLHLSIIKLIIGLYSDPEVNEKNAQLLFTTHNPLIAERNIVSSINVFMMENDNFINVKKIHLKNKRSTDAKSIVKHKNYYNDIFWNTKKSTSKSTLSKLAINLIINSVSESELWQKK